MDLDKFLKPDVIAKRKAVARMMEESYARLNENYNAGCMAHWMIPKIQALNINGGQIKDFGGVGFTNLEQGVIAFEMTKRDCSIASFYFIHNCLSQLTVERLGDDE